MRPATACLSGDASSIRLARALVGRSIGVVPDEVRDSAVLLTSEVVTNAVLHGGVSFNLRLEVRRDRLRVSVTDDDPRPPHVLGTSPDREYGRGMAIVAAEATAWGARLDGHRKTLWFELTLPDDGDGADTEAAPGAGAGRRPDAR